MRETFGGDLPRGVSHYQIRFPKVDIKIDDSAFHEALRKLSARIISMNEARIHMGYLHRGLSTGLAPRLGKAVDI